jgi:hypothetical protein
MGTLVFKGFMADIVQVNWNFFRIIYGTKDPMVKLVDKKWTCLFLWIQSFDKHIKQLIAIEFHDQHKTLCYKYKKAMSLEEVDIQYATIWSWCYLLGIVNEGTIHGFNNWVSFWHFCVRLWGGFMLDVNSSRVLYSIIISICPSWIITSLFWCPGKNCLWRRKSICWLVIYLKQSITFGSNYLIRGVFASLLQCPMILCEHSSYHHCVISFYMVVHLGLV